MPLDLGKAMVQMMQDDQQVIGFDDQDIGILQKDGLGPVPEPMPGGRQSRRVQFLPGQVRLNLGKG